MGIEVVGSEMAQVAVETVTEGGDAFVHEKENGKLDQGLNETIKFGSHENETVKGDETEVSVTNFPKDAVDEWPAPKQIHSFYFVRYRPYDDPKIKARIDLADKEIQRRNQARFQITEALKGKRSDKAELRSQLNSLNTDDQQFRAIMGEKRKEMEPLQNALGKLRNNSASRGGLCSSEEELNDYIRSLQYRMQHESIPLSEERQLLKDIKQLEGTREKVKANSAMRANIQVSMGQKEDIQDQVKLMGVDLDGVRKQQQIGMARIKQIKEEMKAIDKEINSLQEELEGVTQKRDKAYESIQESRKQRDEGNAYFYQSRTLLNKARELAAKKDIQALAEFSHAEVEKFMSLWSGSKDFRDDYEKRILPSLDSRQLSRDGRMRNPDEKPLVVVEAPTSSETDTVAKANIKKPKEDSKSTTQQDSLITKVLQKEANSKAKESAGITSEPVDVADKEISEFEKPRKDAFVVEEVDAAKLKEMKREEEIAKAKLAMERKKKLAEKAASKAAIRAQKEAEKKLKEREKKLKKKATSSGPASSSEEQEAVTEPEEPEKVDGNVEAPVPVKNKVLKEKTIRHRGRPKGQDGLPKSILKRKKSTNYWLWAASAALLVLLFLALGYYYLL